MKQVRIGDTLVASVEIRSGNRFNRRERETETVAELLRELLGDVVRLEHNPAGGPVLVGAGRLYVSISHSKNRAVVALNPRIPVGVDTETVRPQLERVVGKFLSEGERDKIVDLKHLLIAWCVKEASYKVAQIEGLDFVKDITIESDNAVKVRGVSYRYDVVEDGENYVTVLVSGSCQGGTDGEENCEFEEN